MKESMPKELELCRCFEIGRSCAVYNLRKAARAVTRLYDDFLRPSGLRGTQFTLLMSARMCGAVTVTKLAAMSVMDRTTLSRNLTILEKRGLIKVESGNDRRERQVSLTDEGLEALQEAIPYWEKAQVHMIQGLGADKLDGLLKDLAEIVTLARGK